MTLEEVKKNKKIKTFIKQTEKYLNALGYTDHGPRHCEIVANRSLMLAQELALPKKEQEIAAIAGYCHDMGNFLGRTQHHYWGAFLFSQIFLNEPDADPVAVSEIMQAIVSHDKDDLKVVSKITAILILADKSDVHRSRVTHRGPKKLKEDIHERVNYAVTRNEFKIKNRKKQIILSLKIDTTITEPMDYFEIFMDRMTFCRLAAKYLGYNFSLVMNGFKFSA